MSSSSLRTPVVATCAALLLLPSAALAQADPAAASAVIRSHYYPNARLWAMGGVSAALTQDTDGLSANPAAAISSESTKAIIGYLDTRLEHMAQMEQHPEFPAHRPADPIAPSPILHCSHGPEDFCSRFAARCGPGSRWAWGLSADAPADTCGRFLQFGMLLRAHGALTLGLNSSQILDPSPAALHIASLGAAHHTRRWTLAADLLSAQGALSQTLQPLIGAEYRLPGALALRLGSANGNPTYGIGYRRGNWSVDLARVVVSRGHVLLPTVPLTVESDLTVLSANWTY